MTDKLVCPICGEVTSSYMGNYRKDRLCKKHAVEFKNGKLVQCETPQDIKPDSIIFDKSLTRKTIDGSPYKITSTKADKYQTVPICPVVQKELQEYPGESPFFFGGQTPLAENTVTRVFQRYCKKADVKIIRIHDLRHSFVSMLIHRGANFMVVADLIGDTVEQITKTYGHLYEADKRKIVSEII